MRGEQSVINQKVLKHPDNPVKENVKGISAEKIIAVIEEEYWSEWQKKLNYAPVGGVYVRNIGTFFVGFSALKGYIRKLIRHIRSKREFIEKCREEENIGSLEVAVKAETDLIRKLGIAWKQLEEQRILFILRILRWNKKMVEKGTPEKIKVHYERFEWSFISK